MRTFVHSIPRKRRGLQRDRQTSPSGPRVFRVYERVDPNGPFLDVPLREKVIFGETVEDERYIDDCGRVGCEV